MATRKERRQAHARLVEFQAETRAARSQLRIEREALKARLDEIDAQVSVMDCEEKAWIRVLQHSAARKRRIVTQFLRSVDPGLSVDHRANLFNAMVRGLRAWRLFVLGGDNAFIYDWVDAMGDQLSVSCENKKDCRGVIVRVYKDGYETEFTDMFHQVMRALPVDFELTDGTYEQAFGNLPELFYPAALVQFLFVTRGNALERIHIEPFTEKGVCSEDDGYDSEEPAESL